MRLTQHERRVGLVPAREVPHIARLPELVEDVCAHVLDPPARDNHDRAVLEPGHQPPAPVGVLARLDPDAQLARREQVRMAERKRLTIAGRGGRAVLQRGDGRRCLACIRSAPAACPSWRRCEAEGRACRAQDPGTRAGEHLFFCV